MNRINNPINLPNEMSFITLPSVQSFSTDVSVVSPSWLVPAPHAPWPCVEMLCAYLTRFVVRGSYDVKSHSKWVLCPRRSGPSAYLLLMWRLKASAHADTEMFVMHQVKPFVNSGMPEADAQDIFDGMSHIAEDEEEAVSDLISAQEENLETLRKIMCAVQETRATRSSTRWTTSGGRSRESVLRGPRPRGGWKDREVGSSSSAAGGGRAAEL
ncbi:unnamed protein product [Prorocentrum cordatum]|uniref:Uncharacterized protein n=1 Tax=Prorocentrum cordatum TaxID=2364126 RepID=A0ABN9VZZ0_9DINO|nr:unnamed protein product [Polarella glacialis]